MAIFVIGMHRSGTSMVASILQSLGVNLGPDDEMVPANRFNEAGYFENASAVALNESFLKKNDLSWRTAPAIDLKKSLTGVEEYIHALQQISAKLGEKTPWGLKDPRLSFLLPYWKTNANPTSAIICLRRPQAAAFSLHTRNELSITYAAALWELYTLAALRNTRRMNRTLVVYEDLLAHPKKTIETLIESLPELAALRPDLAAIKEAIGRVRRDLDHSKPISKKALPPTVNELYDRLSGGDLSVTKNDTDHGVSLELVRLEAGHQAAKRMSTQAREQFAKVTQDLATERAAFARHTERLGDIVGLISEPHERPPVDIDGMLERLREATRRIPGPVQQGYAEEAARELLRAKDERIEWLRLELGATGSRAQTVLDQATALEVEVARLRAEQESLAIARENDNQEIMRLTAEVSRLHGLLTKAEETRASLQIERARVKADYEIALNKIVAERDNVVEMVENLRARLTEKDSLIAQIQAEHREDEATTTSLRRIAGEREGLLADLTRVTATLEQRNNELAELAAKERNLAQRTYKLDGEIERLQRELMQSRIREAELTSTLASRDQTENVLRAASTQQRMVATEIQHQLSAARATIESLEQAMQRRAERLDELEALHIADRRLIAEHEVRIPILEAASAERDQLAIRATELKAEISRIVAERNRSQELAREREAIVIDLRHQMEVLKKEHGVVIAGLRQQLMAGEDALDEWEDAVEKLKRRLTDMERARDERDATIETLRQELIAAETAQVGRDAIVDDLRRQLAVAQEAQGSQDELMGELRRRLVAAEKEQQDLRLQLVMVENARDEKHSAAAEANVALESVRREARESAGRAQQAEAKLREAETRVADLMRQLDEAAQARQRLEASIANTSMADRDRADQLAKDKRELEQSVAAARHEADDLRRQLGTVNAALDEDRQLKAERDELTRALQAMRARAEQLRIELTTKSNGTNGHAQKAASLAADQRLLRQLLVLNELLQAIDRLLSPKYGRLAIPVRQIRVRLSQARQVLDGEVAMTRR